MPNLVDKVYPVHSTTCPLASFPLENLKRTADNAKSGGQSLSRPQHNLSTSKFSAGKLEADGRQCQIWWTKFIPSALHGQATAFPLRWAHEADYDDYSDASVGEAIGAGYAGSGALFFKSQYICLQLESLSGRL